MHSHLCFWTLYYFRMALNLRFKGRIWTAVRKPLHITTQVDWIDRTARGRRIGCNSCTKPMKTIQIGTVTIEFSYIISFVHFDCHYYVVKLLMFSQTCLTTANLDIYGNYWHKWINTLQGNSYVFRWGHSGFKELYPQQFGDETKDGKQRNTQLESKYVHLHKILSWLFSIMALLC